MLPDAIVLGSTFGLNSGTELVVFRCYEICRRISLIWVSNKIEILAGYLPHQDSRFDTVGVSIYTDYVFPRECALGLLFRVIKSIRRMTIGVTS